MPDAGRKEREIAGPPVARLTPEDRESVVARLSTAFAADRLSTEELELRVEAAYRATSREALARLTEDLGEVSAEIGAAASEAAVAPEISALLGSIERRGPMVVPPRLQIRSILGNVVLDLREADLHDGVTEIHVRAFLGNVEVVLPDDVTVECHGSALLGNFAHSGTRRGSGRDAMAIRTLRVTGRAVLGNVELGADPRRLRRPR